MKKIYRILLTALLLSISGVFAFGQTQKSPDSIDELKGKEIGIYAIEGTVIVVAENAVSGTVQVVNAKGGVKPAAVAVSGSETVVPVNGATGIYVVKVVVKLADGTKATKTKTVFVK